MDETLLVVDAMAGQDAVNVAKTFNETVGIDGIILTKTDGDTRGGAAPSVLSVTGKPIKFQGTGEKLDDLDVFHPYRMASRILGMGDVLSLIERAQDTADEKAAEETAKRMMENKFDMNDMLDQFAQIRKMGGAGAMLSMLPGGSGIDPSQVDEKAFDRIEAMIYSMTKEEREKPSIINPKRKRRIAAGSGTQVSDVNKLLKQFEMMQKMMKQFKKSPKGFARRLGGLMGNPGAFRGTEIIPVIHPPVRVCTDNQHPRKGPHKTIFGGYLPWQLRFVCAALAPRRLPSIVLLLLTAASPVTAVSSKRSAPTIPTRSLPRSRSTLRRQSSGSPTAHSPLIPFASC